MSWACCRRHSAEAGCGWPLESRATCDTFPSSVSDEEHSQEIQKEKLYCDQVRHRLISSRHSWRDREWNCRSLSQPVACKPIPTAVRQTYRPSGPALDRKSVV